MHVLDLTQYPKRDVLDNPVENCLQYISCHGSEVGYNVLICCAPNQYRTWVCFFLRSSSLALQAAMRSANWRLLISKSSCTFSTSTCFLRSSVDCTVLRPVSSNLLADCILHVYQGKISWTLLRTLIGQNWSVESEKICVLWKNSQPSSFGFFKEEKETLQ